MDTWLVFSFASLFFLLLFLFIHVAAPTFIAAVTLLRFKPRSPLTSKTSATAPEVESETPKPINQSARHSLFLSWDERLSVLCYSSRLISPIPAVLKPCFKWDLVRRRERALHKHVDKINHLRFEHCREEKERLERENSYTCGQSYEHIAP